MSETQYLFPLLKRKLGQFSFCILSIGYMIVLLQGVHLLITPPPPLLRLGFSYLTECLFKVNSCMSPICGGSFDSESVNTFSCIAQGMLLVVMFSLPLLLGETWSLSSDARKLNFSLYGVESVNYDVNCAFFREVQSFIININRFSVAIV